jgi:hypothetical protein
MQEYEAIRAMYEFLAMPKISRNIKVIAMARQWQNSCIKK